MIRTELRSWNVAPVWWGLVQLVTGFWVGHLTTLFVAVMVIGILSTAIVVPLAAIGVWVLFLVGHGLARLERSRHDAFTGLSLDDPNLGLSGTNPWARFLERLRSPARWRELLYLLLRLPVSTALMSLALIAWAGGVVLVAMPFYVDDLPSGAAELYLFSIGPGMAAWLAAVVGLAILIQLAPWATVALARADLAFGRSLLAHGSRSDIEEQVVRLETSRVAAVDSAEAERRRIERDLHDGAQQRLIAAAMDLGVAKERLVTDPDAGRLLVDHAHGEVKAALRELRDLVRGIHPVILEDRGLDAALSAVVARSTVPVAMSVQVEPRPSPAVESAAYFIVCEALANVARHAAARHAAVRIERLGDRLRLSVHDDGHGGADPSRGTGLAGLAERVDALGGTWRLSSPAGGPTDIEVELPCAS